MDPVTRTGAPTGERRGWRSGAATSAPIAGAAALVAVLASALVGCGGSISGSGGSGGSGSGGKGGANASGSGGRSSGTGGFSSSGGSTGSGGATSGGSGGSSSSSGGSTGSGGSSGAGTGGVPGCLVKIEPVSPMSFNDIEAAPRVKMKVRASAMYAMTTMPTWSWQITDPLGARLRDDQIVAQPPDRAQVEFPLEMPGNYDIVASVVEDPRCSRRATAFGIPPGRPAYVFRVTAADFPVQDTRLTLPAPPAQTGLAAPAPDVVLSLDPGDVFLIRPRSQGQSNQTDLLSAYVRITNPVTPLAVEGDTALGPVQARLLAKVTYDLLLVPSVPTIAPELLTALPGDWKQGIDLDPGIHVTGKALSSDGKPLAGARLILRRQQRPSTIGTSDDAGNLELWTRSGNLSVMAVPPAGSGLAQASVDVTNESPGLVLPLQVASAPTLSVQWKAVQTGTLRVQVFGVDGVTPVASARVRAASQAWVDPVATVTADIPGSGVTTLPAKGSVIEDAMTDASGGASFAKLPVGTYDVTVVPPSSSLSGPMPPAITSRSMKVEATGLDGTFTLARKATLAIGASAAAKGASITAVDQSAGLAAAPVTATSGSDGAFTLLVDPGRSYQLILEPAPAAANAPLYARTLAAPTVVGAPRTELAAIALSPGRKIAGVVWRGGSIGVDRAFVQVYCQASSSTCVDPETPLAEAVSASDGSFQVVLPASSTP